MKKETPNLPQKTTSNAKQYFDNPHVKDKFKELLGKRASSFMTSVLQIVASNNKLQNADPASIYHAAAVSATLDLPLNNNLGFAYIVPYNSRQTDGSYKDVAQFQLGYKGFIQLAQRSGQFQTINATDVRDGEIKEFNRLTGEISFEWDNTAERLKKPVVGYVGYFKLLNGFEKNLYMTIEELKNHGAKYSKTYNNKSSLWANDFNAMAMKTVTKLLLAKYAPLSVDMQRAVITDQSVIKNSETLDIDYVDNEDVVIDKEAERIRLMIEDATTVDELLELKMHVPVEQMNLFDEKFITLSNI